MSDVPRDEPPEDARPWEEPGAVRRDCAPHRGVLLHTLGNLGLLLCVLTAWWGVGLVGVPLAVAVWGLAARDLRAMAAGRMDLAGRRDTLHAWRLGIFGVIIAATCLALWVAVYVVSLLTH